MEWNSADWLASARRLVHWVNELPQESSTMLLIRHSHRDPIVDHTAQLSTELTELGRRMSFEMGKRLPAHRPAHFFFSFVSRCYQTAEEMSKGFQEVGGTVIDLDVLPVLATPEIYDDEVWQNLQPDGKNITEYVNNWADGNFGDMIEGFETFQGRLLDDTIFRLRDTKESVMHVHITHDLALMAAKRILLERPLEFEDREGFLGCIGIAHHNDGRLVFSSSDEEITLEI
ncbi:MAG: histidine phosphatase family protein [Candidatus Thorarchaeota archaeon]